MMLNKLLLKKTFDSQNFKESLYKLENYISNTNPNFDNLNRKQKAFTLLLLSQGKDGLVRDLWRLIYERKPPTIEEYLSKESLGSLSYMIFPYWRTRLINEIFSSVATPKELILTGSTRSGKTTCGLLSLGFTTIRIGLLKQPQIMLGVAPTSILALMFITINLQKADFGLLKPFIEILKTCFYYKEVKKESDFQEVILAGFIPFLNKGSHIIFGKNMIAFLGSRLGHTLSMSIISAILDEADFRIGNFEEGIDIYLTIRERWRHSFTYLRDLILCLMSSSSSEEGVVSKYIETIDKNDDSILLYSPSVWETRDVDAFKKGKFLVLRGTKSVPSKILDDTEMITHEKGDFFIPIGCEVIPVPKKYHTDFLTGVDRALRNIAGVQTSSYEQIFISLKSFEEYDSSLPGEMEISLPLGGEVSLLQKIPVNIFKVYSNNSKKLKRFAELPRYVHIDLAETTEAGISIVHKELGEENEVLYIVDMIMKVTTPTRIDFEMIQDFFIDLKDKISVNFHKITADGYQSTQLLQKLDKLHIAKEVKNRSVDRTLDSYYQLAKVVWLNKLRIGHCPIIKAQANALKDKSGKAITRLRKDMTDALCIGGNVKIMLLNGTDPTSKELYDKGVKNFWVYSCNLNENKLVPALVEEVIRKSNENSKLVRIFLDNGKVFDCTFDHLVLMRSGKYKKAQDLQVNNSLMPLYINKRKLWENDYNWVIDPFSQKGRYGYKIVAENLLERKIIDAKNRCKEDNSHFNVIHHIDHNKINDDPSNLLPLTNKEHRKLHGDIFTRYNKSPDKRKRTSELAREGKIGLKYLKKIYSAEKFNLMEERRRKTASKTITAYNKSEKHKQDIVRWNTYGQYKMMIEKEMYMNHKIVNIEIIDSSEYVYDLVMPKYHNFPVAGGIFVHNCGSVSNALENVKDIPINRYAELKNSRETVFSEEHLVEQIF